MGFIKKGDRTISLQKIIMEAGYALASLVQWSEHTNWIPNQLEHYYEAKCLIEMAETAVCGSTGGFDSVKIGKKTVFQHQNDYHDDSSWAESGKYEEIFERWLWLFTFYVGGTDKTRFSGEGWYKVGDLKKHFKKK